MVSSVTLWEKNVTIYLILYGMVRWSTQKPCSEQETQCSVSLLKHKSLSKECRLVEAAKRGCLKEVTACLEKVEVKVDATCGERKYTALHWAAERNHTLIVGILLEYGADVSINNVNGTTPLHMAAEKNNLDMVKNLISKNASAEAKNRMGCTPLHWAAHGGGTQVVKFLVGEKANNVNATDGKMGRSVLNWAASRGHQEIVEYLVMKHADIDAQDKILGRSALHWAASRGDLKMADFLISKKANISTRDKLGMTPLSWSAYMGYPNVLQLLIDKGADPIASNKKNHTPFELANLQNHTDVAFLIQQHVTMLKKDYFLTAVSEGRIDAVKNLIESGVKVDVRNADNRNAVDLASEGGHSEIFDLLINNGADLNPNELSSPMAGITEPSLLGRVKLLVERGANLSARNGNGVTPLERAIEQQVDELAKLLLKHMPSVNIARSEETRFFRAVSLGHLGMVKSLARRNAIVNASFEKNLTALHIATISGNFDMVRMLLKLKAFVDALDTKNYTPLHYAVMTNRLDMVNLLLNHRANVDTRSDYHVVPLHVAMIYNSSLGIVKVLIDRGANVNIPMGNGDTPLHIAVVLDLHKKIKLLEVQCVGNGNANNMTLAADAQQGSFELVKLLFQWQLEAADKTINVKDFVCMGMKSRNLVATGYLLGRLYAGRPVDLIELPLHRAVFFNDIEEVKLLVAEKPHSISRQASQTPFTPLHVAAILGSLEMVKYLIQNDTDVAINALSLHPGYGLKDYDDVTWEWVDDGYGFTALHFACMYGHFDVVEVLVQKNASVNTKDDDGNTPLYETIPLYLNITKLLLANKAEINVRNRRDETPLHKACREGGLELVQLLVRNDTKIINSEDRDSLYPLHVACRRGERDIVKFLVEHGAVVNTYDNPRGTPLLVASEYGHLDVVKFLVDNEADVDLPGITCTTALHVACRNGDFKMVEYLLERGNASVNVGSNLDCKGYGYYANPRSPLHEACTSGKLDVVELLVKHDARIDTKDSLGRTPLHRACRDGAADIVEFLVNSNANLNIFDDSRDTPLSIACKFHPHIVRFLVTDDPDKEYMLKGCANDLHPFDLTACSVACDRFLREIHQ